MSDLDLLRGLTESVVPPSFTSLEAVARRRDRRAATTVAIGTALTTVLVILGVASVRSNDQSAPDPADDLDPDRTQTVIDADFALDAVHRYETFAASSADPEHAGESDLSVTADVYGEWREAWWCDGDPGVYYLVQRVWESGETGWLAGGACGGSDDARGGPGHVSQPVAPSDALDAAIGSYDPTPGDAPVSRTLRVVLTDRVPSTLAAECFDPAGGPLPDVCREFEPSVLPDPGSVTFGAAIYSREVEYVATVAGAPVQAQASYDGTEYLFSRGVESMPGTDTVSITTDKPGFVYAVQSDPQGKAECDQAWAEATPQQRQTEVGFSGDSENWVCDYQVATLRLLVDGVRVAGDQKFPSRRDFGEHYGYGAVRLDAGTHEVTVRRVEGNQRITLGLVYFEEAS